MGMLLKDIAEAHLWDYNYWYVSLEDWGKIFEDVLLNMPKYMTDKFDCENFAVLVAGRVSEKYKLNTCAIAIGQSPFAYHGYNLFIADVDGEAKVFILESQNGMIYPIEEPEGYLPELILIG